MAKRFIPTSIWARSLGAFCIVLLVGCSAAPVMNLNNEPIPVTVAGSGRTLEQVQRAILTACSRRGWTAQPAGGQEINAQITIRGRHTAKIAIAYTTTDYSIRYVDSDGLDYKNGRIHRNYNRWVIKLSQTIQREFGVRAQGY